MEGSDILTERVPEEVMVRLFSTWARTVSRKYGSSARDIVDFLLSDSTGNIRLTDKKVDEVKRRITDKCPEFMPVFEIGLAERIKGSSDAEWLPILDYHRQYSAQDMLELGIANAMQIKPLVKRGLILSRNQTIPPIKWALGFAYDGEFQACRRMGFKADRENDISLDYLVGSSKPFVLSRMEKIVLDEVKEASAGIYEPILGFHVTGRRRMRMAEPPLILLWVASQVTPNGNMGPPPNLASDETASYAAHVSGILEKCLSTWEHNAQVYQKAGNPRYFATPADTRSGIGAALQYEQYQSALGKPAHR